MAVVCGGVTYRFPSGTTIVLAWYTFSIRADVPMTTLILDAPQTLAAANWQSLP